MRVCEYMIVRVCECICVIHDCLMSCIPLQGSVAHFKAHTDHSLVHIKLVPCGHLTEEVEILSITKLSIGVILIMRENE